MKIDRANFDYEYQLYSLSKAGAPKVAEEFECLYFFSENNPGQLLTQKSYSNEYLDYVSEKTGIFPTVTKIGKANNWWGSLENIDLEKKLNSKITSAQFAQTNNLCHKTTKIINDPRELVQTQELMILKDPHLMSGRGFFRYDSKTVNQASEWSKNRFPLIQESWLLKQQDLGSYYFPHSQQIVTYLNFSNTQGNYKGTRLWQNPVDNFDELRQLGINLDQFFENIVKVKDYYLAIGATQGFSIDSFTYLEANDPQVHCYYLSEVNYRKTMGWVTYQLRKYLSDYKVGEFIIHKRKNNYQSVAQLTTQINNDDQIMLLSPPENQFLLFFLKSQDKKHLKTLEESINNL